MISIGPRDVDSLRLQEFFSRNETLRRQFIVTKRAKKLAHQDITLHFFDLNVSHISRNQFDSILQILVNDHISQGYNCIGILVESNNFHIGSALLCSSERPSNQRTSTCSEVQNDNLFVFKWELFTIRIHDTVLVLHYYIFRLFLSLERRVSHDTSALSLQELSILLHISECFLASLLI